MNKDNKLEANNFVNKITSVYFKTNSYSISFDNKTIKNYEFDDYKVLWGDIQDYWRTLKLFTKTNWHEDFKTDRKIAIINKEFFDIFGKEDENIYEIELPFINRFENLTDIKVTQISGAKIYNQNPWKNKLKLPTSVQSANIFYNKETLNLDIFLKSGYC